MREVELVAAKPLVSVRPIVAAVGVIYSGGTHRIRVTINKTDFAVIYEPKEHGSSPKSSFYGNAAQGIMIELSAHTGVRIDQAAKNTVALNASGKEMDVAANRVETVQVKGVMALYGDDTAYIFLAPLPDKFLATAKQRARRDGSKDLRPLVAIEQAMIAAKTPLTSIDYLAPTETKPAETATTTVRAMTEAEKAAMAPTHTPFAAATASIAEQLKSATASVSDMKAAIDLVNEGRRRLTDGGINVALSLVDGELKGTVEVKTTVEL